MPDGTIICGHQRVAAARLLGWTEIKCVIRHDLAAASGNACGANHGRVRIVHPTMP